MADASPEIAFLGGTPIAEAAKLLVATAVNVGGLVQASFNGIVIRAEPDSDPDAVRAQWQRDMDAAADAYRNSPDGIADAKRSEEERQRLQAAHDDLMQRLQLLEFRNDESVIDWLYEMQPASDRVGVIVRRQTIIDAFAARGFRAGENTGDRFNPESRSNVFRYLVGQALDGLANGSAIHGIFRHFADQWRAKFVGARSC